MDSLSKKHNRKTIRSALQNLPEKLDDTYGEVMERISNQDKDDVLLANQVLSWITHAFRPLTIKEIQHALAVLPGDTELDKEAVNDIDLLVSVCGGIVTIDRESKIVRLVHYTTQQYLSVFGWPNFRMPTSKLGCLVFLISRSMFSRRAPATPTKIWIAGWKATVFCVMQRNIGATMYVKPRSKKLARLCWCFLSMNSKYHPLPKLHT